LDINIKSFRPVTGFFAQEENRKYSDRTIPVIAARLIINVFNSTLQIQEAYRESTREMNARIALYIAAHGVECSSYEIIAGEQTTI
jgi:hypothetical protein